MDILGLTSFEQLRGVLTVSTADLPDRVLAPYGLQDDLEADLLVWLPEWQDLDSGSRESRLLKLYAKYRCAAWVAASGQNFTLVQFTDGANAGQRSDTEGFQELRRHLEGRANQYRQQIEDMLSTVPEDRFRPAMGGASPTRDPVTEGR